MQTAEKKQGRKLRVLLWVVLLAVLTVLTAGCFAKTEDPRVADADAQETADIEAVEAWLDTLPVEEGYLSEEDARQPHTEYHDITDENGKPIGQSVVDYDADDRVTREEHFDLEGNSTTRWERSYSEDGSVETTNVYEYNEFRTRMVSYYYEDGSIAERYTYDETERLMTVEVYAPEGYLTSLQAFSGEAGEEWMYGESLFGPDGTLLAENVYDEGGKTSGNIVRERDAFGREIRFMMTDENGRITMDNRTVYDADGNIARVESYDENGKLKDYSVEELDAEGRTVRYSVYNPDDVITQYTLIYYKEDGRREKTEYYELYEGDYMQVSFTEYGYWPDGSYRTYTYSPDGELLATERCNADGSPYSF